MKYLNKIVIEIGKYKLGKGGRGKGDLNNWKIYRILWCEHKSRTKKSFQNRLALYSIRQSDENRIMRTVKEIWSNFNQKFSEHFNTCSPIKSVFVILFVFYFSHCSVSAFATFQRNTKKGNIWYVFCNNHSVVLMSDVYIFIYLNQWVI